MGVPAFFRWLSRKYPKIIIPAVEEDPVYIDGVQLPPSYSSPNQNGELDNLYLDMNGIVHPCTHPEGRPAPETEDEMMIEVFRYTERVVSLAKPRKVLMIAVDGVAPRAKMNQQRSRRFRAAQDAKAAAEAQEQKEQEARMRGEEIDAAVKKGSWDTNSITPGTPFMDFLATSLRYWVAYKLNSDPGWKDLKVIISDATVPGEGEHKVMNFVRSQRNDPQYDPNTTHCIYGLDADLIFLGLATHEPHFRILREDVFQQNKVAKDQAHFTATINGDEVQAPQKPFIWLDIGILRQYLEVELDLPHQGFPFDLERAIDDWIFMAFFCGNDFLPHLPSLDVRENGIDVLLWSWRRDLGKMRDYMTCDGNVDLQKVSMLLSGVASQEGEIFRRRHEQEERRERAFNNRANQKNQRWERRHGGGNAQGVAISKGTRGQDVAPINPLAEIPLYSTSGEVVGEAQDEVSKHKKRKLEAQVKVEGEIKAEAAEVKEEAKEEAKEAKEEATEAKEDVKEESVAKKESGVREEQPIEVGKPIPQPQAPQAPLDSVQLWEPGYHKRYYKNKFDIDPQENPAFVQTMAEKYIEGVCWVLKYYYQGCPSWTWYYPYHYAPFAQDMTNLGAFRPVFDNGEPFLPYEQLMSVLPAASSHTLPAIFRTLMADKDSPIVDFYPEDFPIDMNGKKMSWQGIAILPFIDEHRLLKNVRAQYDSLTQAERDRNVRKEPILLVSGDSSIAQDLLQLYTEPEATPQVNIRCWKSGGLSGRATKEVEWEPHQALMCPIQAVHLPDIAKNTSMSVEYFIDEHSAHKSMLMQGCKLKENQLTEEQMEIIRHRRVKSDRRDERFDRREEARFQALDGYAEPTRKRTGGYQAFVEEVVRQSARQQHQWPQQQQWGHPQGHAHQQQWGQPQQQGHQWPQQNGQQWNQSSQPAWNRGRH